MTARRFSSAKAQDQTVGAKIDTVMQKDLQISMTAIVKGGDQWVPFNQRKLQAVAVQFAGGIQQLEATLKQAGKIPDANKKKQATQQIETQLKAAEAQYAELQKLGTQLQSIATEKNVYVKFRVFYDTGTNKVTLIDGQTPPEPPVVPGGPKRE